MSVILFADMQFLLPRKHETQGSLLVIMFFKDTQREKAPSNKSRTLTKNLNMDICVVGALNQFFRRGS